VKKEKKKPVSPEERTRAEDPSEGEEKGVEKRFQRQQKGGEEPYVLKGKKRTKGACRRGGKSYAPENRSSRRRAEGRRRLSGEVFRTPFLLRNRRLNQRERSCEGVCAAQNADLPKQGRNTPKGRGKLVLAGLILSLILKNT